MLNKKNLSIFKAVQISAKDAAKTLGGASQEHCDQLEADMEAALAAGDYARARQLIALMSRICLY